MLRSWSGCDAPVATDRGADALEKTSKVGVRLGRDASLVCEVASDDTYWQRGEAGQTGRGVGW